MPLQHTSYHYLRPASTLPPFVHKVFTVIIPIQNNKANKKAPDRMIQPEADRFLFNDYSASAAGSASFFPFPLRRGRRVVFSINVSHSTMSCGSTVSTIAIEISAPRPTA